MAIGVGIPNNGYVPTHAGRVYAPHQEKRIERQDARIADGVANGNFNPSEVKQLHQMKAEYRNDLKGFKETGGAVLPDERKALQQDLNGISQSIYAFKHN
jgi:hypothetical protein